MAAPTAKSAIIKAPEFIIASVIIQGTAPLVIERFSKKAEIMAKMAEGNSAKNKKERKARDYEEECHQSKYFSQEKWEGFNAAALRAGMISACRLVGFKMTIAKLSAFVEADGWDNDGIPLVRIYGNAETFTAHTRNATGVIDVRSRPMYKQWAAKLTVRFDSDQFKIEDMLALLSRVGGQVGIGAGRPDSKDSAGCGWGLFQVVSGDNEDKVRSAFGIE